MAVLLKSAPPRARRPACRHCGSPVPAAPGGDFCCPGCAYVHRLIEEHGFEAYYRIKDAVTAPAAAAVFEPRDYGWLAERQRAAEAAGGAPRLTLEVQGISCAACVWLIEAATRREPGMREVRADASAGSLEVAWSPGSFDAPAWAGRLQAFGYLVGPAGELAERLESAALGRRAGLCGAFALNVMLFTLPAYFGMSPDFAYAGVFRLLALLFATLSVLVGGSYFCSRALAALRAGATHVDQPIALGIAGAYAGSLLGWISGRPSLQYFDFVATFTLLMLAGRWAQVRAVERNRRRILRLQPLPPRYRLCAGGEVAREELRPGQHFQVAAGQAVPVESELLEAGADFSLASISGEPLPRPFERGQLVPAGAANVGRGPASLAARQGWGQSLLSQLIAPTRRRAASAAWLDRIVRGYVFGIIAAAAAAGLGWEIATGDAARAGAAAVAVLVVSCPCAIGLALPLADEIAIAGLRRRGVFVRESDLWHRLRRVRAVAFDKTGTLTLESPVLLNPEELRALAPEARAALAALVQGDRHPVGQALWEALLVAGGTIPLAGDVRETPGSGVTLGAWSLGKAGWADRGPAGEDTVLARDGAPIAHFRFCDAVRPDAREDIGRLCAAGFPVFILSGDHPAKVRALAAALGLPEANAHGGLSAEDKARWLAARAPHSALMLGDGANDTLAFREALCRGTPVVHRGILEAQADFYYLRRGIGGVRDLLAVGRAHARTQRMVVGYSLAYNLAAVGVAAAGRIGPLAAAILMPASSLLSLAIVTFGLRSANVTADAQALLHPQPGGTRGTA
ncbi:MAG TPA: heavy metal translocating P-type ATPase metal-binding domain-containing protein [Opitutaceae bacterium]|nr:heavy metal translocating P-type ATPase metal-binding domain-containing protein [Opitutaceae bacterium]